MIVLVVLVAEMTVEQQRVSFLALVEQLSAAGVELNHLEPEVVLDHSLAAAVDLPVVA